MSIILVPLAQTLIATRKKKQSCEAKTQSMAPVAQGNENGLLSRAFARFIEAVTEKARQRVAAYRRIIGRDPRK